MASPLPSTTPLNPAVDSQRQRAGRPGVSFYQKVQERARQTEGVVQQIIPGKKVGGRLFPEVLLEAEALSVRAAVLEDALAALSGARAAYRAAWQRVRRVTLQATTLVQGKTGHLPDMSGLLEAVFALVPRTPALATARARALLPVWERADAVLAALTPPEPPITWDGVGAAACRALVEGLPALAQQVSTAQTEVQAATAALRQAARTLDRWNKRFYLALQAELRAAPEHRALLARITTCP